MTAVLIFSAFGMKASSSTGLNGTGVSGAVTRRTGASRRSKPSSATSAATSAPKPQVFTASWAMTILFVLASDVEHRVLVEGHERPQIDHLGLDAVGGQQLRRGQRLVDHGRPRHDRDVGSLPASRRPARAE